jgi:hypothetical protein
MNPARSIKNHRGALLLLVLLAVGLGCAGCGSTEPRNASAKPWNSPEGWQNGNIPGMMTQPH